MKNIFLALLAFQASACSVINIFEYDEKYLELHLEACGEKKELKLLYEKPLKVQVCGKDILLEKVGRVLYLNGPVNQIIIQAPRKEIFLTGDLWFRSSLEIGSFLL